jgi:nucleoside-diphosphate-sugar epimerase
MVILVTGASGFLGRHTLRTLAGRGHRVRAMDLPGAPPPPEAAESVEGDIRDRSQCRAACAGVEAIVHLAARVSDFGPRQAFVESNLEGTHQMLEAAAERGARRFVLVSSVLVHDFPQYGADEDCPRERRRFPYAETKRAAEDLCQTFHREGRLEAVVARPGVFPFGPGDRRVTYRLLERLCRRKTILCARGRGVTTTAYAENLAHGLALCAEVSAAAGRVYLIDDGEPLTWFDLLDRFADALEVKRPRYGPPLWVALGAAALAEAGARLLRRDDAPLTRYRARLVATDFYFRSSRARTELGYEPLVSLDEGVARTARWFREQRLVSRTPE